MRNRPGNACAPIVWGLIGVAAVFVAWLILAVLWQLSGGEMAGGLPVF